MKKSLLVLAVALVVSTSARAADLEFGDLIEGSTSGNDPAVYTFEADVPGLLTLVARSESDIVLIVTDATGQPLVDGRIDSDFRGNAGSEHGMVVLSQEGEYQVMVLPYGSDADFELVASWIPWEDLELPADEDGNPLAANDLELDEWTEGEIGYELGDDFDWYRFEAQDDGELTVVTRGSEGDVVLERYQEDSYLQPVEHSDDDIDGENTNEMLTLDVDEGDVLYFRVRSYGSGTEYEIQATLEGAGGGGGGGGRPRIEK